MPLLNNDKRFQFLSDVVRWLDEWKILPNKRGKLTAQTFTSFRHSCIVLEEIVNHLTKNCGFTYVLSVFLQNDPIEHRFGIYRMMSGAQYNVQFLQFLQFSSYSLRIQLVGAQSH